MADRSQRAQLQATIGELGTVRPYQWRVDDLEHPEVGFYVTPAGQIDSCACGLCEGFRAGRDVHLGSISRMAHIRAGALVNQHLAAAA